MFYHLVLQTRRRHGVPPQPTAWFRNLMDCLGETALIRCAHKAGRPIAGILTLQYGKSLYYKYGASDEHFHKSGAMPLLLWEAIQDAILHGLEELDMGRSDCDNIGLVTFKERWSATRSPLSYYRWPVDVGLSVSNSERKRRIARTLCGWMPDSLLEAVGTLAYRHID
jgi:lipid II:glycine glycyltransferase (peptidoglycan interpeptide bridge formation enzyme)